MLLLLLPLGWVQPIRIFHPQPITRPMLDMLVHRRLHRRPHLHSTSVRRQFSNPWTIWIRHVRRPRLVPPRTASAINVLNAQLFFLLDLLPLHEVLSTTTSINPRMNLSKIWKNEPRVFTLFSFVRFVQTCSYRSHTTCDHQHSQVSTNDDPTSTRNLSMNIPVDNSNHDRNEHSFPTASALNIELEEEDDEDADGGDGIEREQTVQNEQLEVFVGFYRPGEYQRETLEDDDDDHEADTSETSQKSDPQKKQEQVDPLLLRWIESNSRAPLVLLVSARIDQWWWWRGQWRSRLHRRRLWSQSRRRERSTSHPTGRGSSNASRLGW